MSVVVATIRDAMKVPGLGVSMAVAHVMGARIVRMRVSNGGIGVRHVGQGHRQRKGDGD